MKKLSTFQFDSAMVGNEFVDSPVIEIEDGLIKSILCCSDEVRSNGVNIEDCEIIEGTALPGMPNLHSHAFQRAFAGLSEFQTSEHDSFWTWRNLMYDFVLQLDPDQMYEIAKQLYSEMRAVGYTWVGEFHYVHNDKDGSRYANTSTLAEAVTSAALDVGIGICLLPTLYQRGGFNKPLQDGQRRFELDTNSFLTILENCESKFGSNPNFNLGMALHSLRAVDVAVGQDVVSKFQKRFPDRPVHIHVAEQLAEQEECLAATGKTPIEFLFDHFTVDSSWCLIHSTHANKKELKLMADSQCVVGLCPTTEANLGDGVFPAEEFLAKGGKFGVGSDSHIAINVAAELRLIEYAQRLVKRRRAILGTEGKSVGTNLFTSAALGGAQALGLKAGSVEVGQRADLMIVDSWHPTIGGATGQRMLDRFVFCEHGSPVVGTMIGGKLN